jgi:hypothetical protein
MAGAPKNNKNAEKWTLDEALTFINNVKDYIKQNPSCVYIGEAITEQGQYTQLWSYLKDIFAENSIVFESTRECESILEQRLYNGGVHSELNARLVEFGLVNNHGWEHRRNVDHTTKGEKLNGFKVTIADE